MSKKVTVTLPKLGESILGATILHWLKKVGDRIAIDEGLVEVSTDKVNSEIPSPVKGILKEILAKENEEIEVGAPLASIEIDDEFLESVSPEIKLQENTAKSESREKASFFSPSVLRYAQMEGITIEVLQQMEGTGEGGRVTKKDIEKYASTKKAPCPLKSEPKVASQSSSGTEDRIKMTGLRKAIAENMVRSFYEAPHASLVIEADVTDIMNLIAREKKAFLDNHGAKLTITSFIIQALTKALSQFPLLNASLEDETIILKRFINVGIAVNIEGGLVVPVIKNCQERNLVSIAKSVSDLSQRARNNKLAPDDITQGSVTLTNFGMTGALIGVPIIRYPEVAIIGAGTIKKRVVVKDDDSFAIRQMMYLTLTFDHRVIDGIYGCEFLNALKHNLESIN